MPMAGRGPDTGSIALFLDFADAQAELDKAPFFVKGPAKEGAEKYAREIGATEVTLVSKPTPSPFLRSSPLLLSGASP